MVLTYRALMLQEGEGHKRLVRNFVAFRSINCHNQANLLHLLSPYHKLARKERRAAKLGNSGSSWIKIMKFYGEQHLKAGLLPVNQ